MANTINSSYMALPIPIVTQDPGPQYATDLNTCLTLIDQHNHQTGSGQQITPPGLNINQDLPFGSNNATQLRTARFTAQSGPLASSGTDIGCVYVASADLYYNDTNGNQVRLTQAGSIAGAIGSITGLVPPANVTYNAPSQTFIFQSTTATAANLDAGSIILRDLTSGSSGITLAPPASLPVNYQLTLPSSAAAFNNFVMQSDTSGNLSFNSRTQYQFQATTGVYSIKKNDDIISASALSAPYTLTLPSPVGIQGKTFDILMATTANNLVTISPAAGSILDSVNSYANVTLNTGGEKWSFISDNVNYRVLRHFTDTPWIGYPIATSGLGTPASAVGLYQRRGNCLNIQFMITAGTVSGVTARFNMPNGLVADPSAVPSITLVGSHAQTGAGAAMYTVLAQPSDNCLYWSLQTGTQAGLATQVGTSLFSTGETFAGYAFNVPIQGWYA